MKSILKLAIIFLSFPVFLINAQIGADKVNQNWDTDTTKKLVPLSEFRALLKRDGIPPIDNPKYWGKAKGLKAYFEYEPVILVKVNSKTKAFPLNILTYHELVNDELENIKFTASYCPLCNAAIVFNRELKFKNKSYTLDFGVSGMLRKSDMVMWDRQTESWWQQFEGKCLVGKLAGAELEMLPAQILSVKEYFNNYPDGLILSTDTGFDKQKKRYGSNVYENYDNITNKKPRLFFEDVDSRLHAMERIINISFDGVDKIYPQTILQKEKVINDKIKGLSLVLFHQSGAISVLDAKDLKTAKKVGSTTVFDRSINGSILEFKFENNKIIDVESKSVWSITGKCLDGKYKNLQLTPLVYGNHFAFAWFAFHPDCLIYGQ